MSSRTQIGRWHGLVVDCPEHGRPAIFYQELLGVVRVQAVWIRAADLRQTKDDA